MRFALAGCLALLPLAALSQVATESFDVRITIAEECEITSTETLDFGNAGVLSTNVDATAVLQVTCTNSTPYDIALDAGDGSGATVGDRLMTSAASDTITYRLYSDSGRTSIWGETSGTDTQGATGNGSAQSYTIYGRVPVQTTPAAGDYTDTVGVTVTY